MKTTLYKLNNSNRVSWWTIESLPEGYSVAWGQDHENINVQDNITFTQSQNVEENVQSKINMMIARKGYSRDVPTTLPDLPMLAQTWKDYKQAVLSDTSQVRPHTSLCVQPKYDGIRCLATCVSMKSRRNTPITSCPHVEIALESLLSNSFANWSSVKFDGELYIPGADLQTTQSAVRCSSYHPMLWSSVKYVIFDVVDTELTYNQRLSILHILRDALRAGLDIKGDCKFSKQAARSIEVAPTYNISTQEEELVHYHRQFVSAGYEGTIVRNLDGMYRPNYRSYDLLKYKDFLDSEFEIVDVVAGKDDCAIFVCKTAENRRFRVNPSFPKTRKQQILIYKQNYIGKQLVVKYEKLSIEGVPLKPIGVTIL